ncbi:hypothetical protein BU23DRAFT_101921 [Bimuria novae-zelandiae CBS 107.79]|uniref:Uncharacterized protein n=1 Tax=Bimuria novae-zelandiae CBS 107.79 TaxID=1447943 RepID=A0A6A5VQW8_9PLEO|nr:hypothetical protein BU23DRAFT_101921 [Bimuria novae-zelandiae CBS 107.79]
MTAALVGSLHFRGSRRMMAPLKRPLAQQRENPFDTRRADPSPCACTALTRPFSLPRSFFARVASCASRGAFRFDIAPTPFSPIHRSRFPDPQNSDETRVSLCKPSGFNPSRRASTHARTFSHSDDSTRYLLLSYTSLSLLSSKRHRVAPSLLTYTLHLCTTNTPPTPRSLNALTVHHIRLSRTPPR